MERRSTGNRCDRAFAVVLWAGLWLIPLGPALLGTARAQPLDGLGLGAPHDAISFEHLDAEQGLSDDWVFAALQDEAGYMWFGTRAGLDRYDGHSFTSFRHVPTDSTSITSGFIHALLEDHTGALWIGTLNGLNKMDRTTGTFTRYVHDPDDPSSLSYNVVGDLYEDERGTLWVGTFGGGLNRLDRSTGAFVRYQADPDDPSSLSNNTVHAIHEDRAGTLWVATIHGLNRYNLATDDFTRYLFDPSHFNEDRPYVTRSQRLDAVIIDFIEDADSPGVFWLSTSIGLSRFVPRTGALERVITYPVEPQPTGSWWTLPEAIERDPASPHVLWVAVQGVGLYRVDTRTRSHTLYPEAQGTDGLQATTLLSLYRDRAGVLWALSLSGVDRFPPASSSFTFVPRDASVTALHTNRTGASWIGTGGTHLHPTVHRWDPGTETWTDWRLRWDAPPPRQSRSAIWDLHVDRDGVLWAGTQWGGLQRLDVATGALTQYTTDAPDSLHLSHHTVRAIHERRDGTLWIGTGRGLHRIDPATGRITSFMQDPKAPAGTARDDIWAIRRAPAGTLWLATRGGVHRFDPATGTFSAVPCAASSTSPRRPPHVVAIHPSATDSTVLWLATDRGGLDRLHIPTGRCEHVPLSTKKNDYLVAAFLEAERGRLWMSTRRGTILRFDPAANTVRPFGDAHGVSAEAFNPHAAASLGPWMLFGGPLGLTAFPPHRIRDNPHPPPVVLTDVRAADRSLDADASAAARLPRDQNTIAFTFAALHFKNPTQNRYAYRLDGADADWVQAGTRRTAMYTDLAPGSYTFHVKAANSDGVWNETGTSFRFRVVPPWWRTGWAYAAYAALLAGGLVVGYRLRERHVYDKEREAARIREAERQAETAEETVRTLQAVLVHPEDTDLPSDDAAFLNDVLRIIEAHLGDSRFTVDHLADAMALSRRHLTRRVRDVADETPGKLIRRMRLQRAAQLLEQRAGTVSEIAHTVGFSSASHFAQAFRQHMGVPPSEYAEDA